jgi:hypothetical protein
MANAPAEMTTLRPHEMRIEEGKYEESKAYNRRLGPAV